MLIQEARERCLHDNIFLIKRFPIEEFGEINHRVERVERVVRIRAVRFAVFMLDSIEMIGRPVHRGTKSA